MSDEELTAADLERLRAELVLIDARIASAEFARSVATFTEAMREVVEWAAELPIDEHK